MKMKVNTYEPISNMGVLEKNDEVIEIKNGRWIDKNNTSHPMKFTKIYSFQNNFVYWLTFFGKKSKNAGIHISLNFFENQKFLWLQNSHWLQKEENIRYIVNVLFLISGLTFSILNILK